MLIGAAQGLSQVNDVQFLKNALLECFTIHMRALVDFLWEPSRLREDDALAKDFFNDPNQWETIRPKLPLVLEPIRGRTGKEIAHLTYARMTVTPETKGWNVQSMTEEAFHVLKLFIENADESKIGSALANL